MTTERVENQPGDEQPEEFYAKRKQIYVRKATGMFANLRTLAVIALFAIYYILPWINYGDRQAILWDLAARKFHIFGTTFWPQDFFYLAIILIILAYLLFFVTALAGRLWCGYACPQTVYTEFFMWVERLFEGDRPKQIKLDKAPWHAEKILRKGGKHATWILFSLFTGFTFAGYFFPIRELFPALLAGTAGSWATFWTYFYALATWGLGAMMREQVCTYMCPYARFQSAMFDRDTLIISYDEARGEPRGKHKKSMSEEEAGQLGDCIDCTMCVQVCPTGIDIRDGLQYQCIACAACIDACDQIMEQIGKPKGLVKYTTEHAMQGKASKVLRLRTFIYAGVLVTLVAGLLYSVSQRIPLELDVIRDRNTLYRENGDGMLENVFIMKVANMDTVDHQYQLSVSGLEGIALLGDATEPFPVATGEVLTKIIKVEVDPVNVPETTNDVVFHVEAITKPSLTDDEKSRFIGPMRK